jgi:multidrug efflux system outer membrane protein
MIGDSVAESPTVKPASGSPPTAALPDPGLEPLAFGLARKWWLALIVVVGCALTEMAFSGVLFATPVLIQAIETDAYRYGWALGPYLVLLIVFAVYATKLQQRFGSRVVFIAGMLCLGGGALVAAGAQSLPQLVLARLLMSGKGMALAVALTQLWLAFPLRKGLALSFYGCSLYGGMALGIGLGAFVAFDPSWRVAYLVCGVGGLLAAWAGWRVLIPDRPAGPVATGGAAIGWDLPGLLLLAISIAAATFLSLWGQYYGWFSSPGVLIGTAIMLLTAALFIWREMVAADPIVSLSFMPFRTLVLTLGVLGVYGAALVGLFETLPTYFLLRGYQGPDVGALMLPCGIVFCLFVLAGGAFTTRRWTVHVLRAGMLIFTIGVLLLLRLDLYTSRWWIGAVLMFWAAGAGLVLPTALVLTFAEQTPEWVQRLASIKVALRFLALIFGSNAVAMIAQRGADANFDRLRQEIAYGRPVVFQVQRQVELHATSLGQQASSAERQASVLIARWVRQNADWLGYRDGILYLAALSGSGLLLTLLIRSRREPTIFDSDEALPGPATVLREHLWFVPHVRSLAGPMLPLGGLSALIAMGAAQGCAQTPPYARPPVAIGAQWRTDPSPTPSGATIADLAWWQLFQDEALRSLVAEALEENRDLALAAARIAEARAALRRSGARQLPQAAAGASVEPRRYSENSPLSPPGGPGWTFYDAAIEVSYELDFWGRIQAGTDAARAELLASEEALRTVTIALVADVAATYFELRSVDRALAIVIAAAADRAESLRIVRERERHGVASELEVAQAEAEHEGTAAEAPEYERRVSETEDRLSVLLGRDSGPIARGLAIGAQPVPPALPAGVPSDLLLRRPDIRAAEQSLIASNFRIGEARAAFYPRVILFGAGGIETVDASEILDASSLFGRIGPAIGVPLFTGGRLEGELDAATARQEQAVAIYQQSVLEALREVNESLVSFQKSGERLDRMERQVAAAGRALEAAGRRYLHGLSSYLDVLDAQRVLLAAQLDEVSTRRERLTAVVRLYKSLGGGWSREGIPEAEEVLGSRAQARRTAGAG